MIILRLTGDGSIDHDSHDAYLQHLESIRIHVDSALYELLKFPSTAYRSGRTIYDSILMEWRGTLERDSWESRLELRILTPNFDREFRFAFSGDLGVTQPTDGKWFSMGPLYCLELTRQDDGLFSFCFMNIARAEVRIDCREYSFQEINLPETTKLQ